MSVLTRIFAMKLVPVGVYAPLATIDWTSTSQCFNYAQSKHQSLGATICNRYKLQNFLIKIKKRVLLKNYFSTKHIKSIHTHIHKRIKSLKKQFSK